MPDYAALLKSDPGLLAAQADLQASGVANAAQRNAAFQRDVVDWGKLPDLASASSKLGIAQGDLAGILGPDIGKLADENTAAGTSQLARLNAANAKQIQGITNALAARGIYNSGETGYQLGQNQTGYQNAQYDALQKVLDAMAGAQGSYVSAEQQREMALASAASDAANRVLGQYPAYPGSPGMAPTTAHWIGADTAGRPVYMDASGNLYNHDASPYSGPAEQGSYGMGTGPYRPDPQTPDYVASHTSRYGF